MSERIKTRTGLTWLDEDRQILRFVYDLGAVCTLADAQENSAIQVNLAQGRRLPVLCDITRIKSIDAAARKYYGDSEDFEALALVTNSAIGTMIGNLFLATYRKRVAKTRLFRSETDAIEWIERVRERDA
jgi:hypothetical protein